MDSVCRGTFVTFLVLLFAGSSFAIFVLKSGRCPNITGQTQFDRSRYEGAWYEYQRFPDIVGGRLDCTSYTFHNTWYAMSVIKKGTLRSNLFGNKFVLRNITALGLATTPDTDKPAEFNLVFGEKAAPGQKANYMIHDTDYKTYSVVFSCSQVENLNIQYAWILTRVRGVAPPNLPQLESKLTDAGVDVSAFFVVHQKGCPGK